MGEPHPVAPRPPSPCQGEGILRITAYRNLFRGEIPLKNRIRRGRNDASDALQLRQQCAQRWLVGVEGDQNMAGTGDNVERNIFGGAGCRESGDKARPLVSFQQDDPAREWDDWRRGAC